MNAISIVRLSILVRYGYGRFLTITWFLIGIATAQNNELTEVYVALDDSFQFQYPIDWEIDDSQEFVQLNNITEDPQQRISFNFFSPNVVNTLLADTAEPLTTAAEVLSAIRSLDTYTDILVGEVASQIDNGREVAFISAAVGAESGFATVADFGDGQYAFVISLTDLVNLTQETAMVHDPGYPHLCTSRKHGTGQRWRWKWGGRNHR